MGALLAATTLDDVTATARARAVMQEQGWLSDLDDAALAMAGRRLAAALLTEEAT